MYNCALCTKHVCSNGDIENAPKNCPCTNDKMKDIEQTYNEEDNYQMAHISTKVTMDGYCKKTRLEEIIDYAKGCGYKKLGLAFCIGLADEARTLNKVLTYHGFEVDSIICKNGNISKRFINVDSDVTMCNPIGQAVFLNKEKTDLNIILGLCVGHDTLFIEYSEAPVTTFAVKDRVLAHNPLGVIYQAEAYYKDKLFPPKEDK